MNGILRTTEQYSSHIPALQTLVAAGWTFMSAEECLSARGSTREVLMREILIKTLSERRFEYKGAEHALSNNAIEQIVRELSDASLREGLISSNERLYNKLCLGVTVTEFIDGKKKHSPTIPIIDWKNPKANSFVVTEELEVLSSGGARTRRPDIVCYVNGIPLAVIEAKRPDSGNPNKSMIEEGISQNIRNQGNDEIPHLFVYSQLLLSVNGEDGRYATTKTPGRLWAKWREEEFDEEHFSRIKNASLSDETRAAIFANRLPEVREYFESLWSQKQLATDQDRLIVSLLSPERLLEFVRFHVLFVGGKDKIVSRYHQFFGIRALVRKIEQGRGGKDPRGGVVWHTTGSGKSLTMVFLCKTLLLHPTLRNCRFVVVTDRIDLEKQLARAFLAGGAFGSEIAGMKAGERAKVSSGRDLAKRIGRGDERIIFSIIDKFATASKLAECRNESEDIVVLVDEGHRSHEGETHQRMRKALPNACYIAFTGTPLLKEEKTENRFGPIVHAYTMRRAVEDGAVTPLLYEERVPELDMDAAAVDSWFEKITADISETQKDDLRKKWGRAGAVYGSDNRIRLIAWDIAVHFNENFKKLGQGLKGQVATQSRSSAIRYKKHLDETGLVTSAVVISPPDAREGHSDVDETPEIQAWWKENVRENPREYERDVIDRFGTDGPPDLLVVVDKLLTGFDEPRNAVLYIDKQLSGHNVIQAIARVNRLHDAKRHGLLIDYRGILRELDTAIREYQDHANRTQRGYDIEDLDGLYSRVDSEYRKLPRLRERLRAIFSPVKNKKDPKQYRDLLEPQYEEDAEGSIYDARQEIRENFYAALTEYGMCLKTALSSRSFFEDSSVTDALVDAYKGDLRFFASVRRNVRQDASETVAYSAYEDQIQKLVDERIEGRQVHAPGTRVSVDELGGGGEDPEKWTEDEARNRTDMIRSRIRRVISQEMEDDPYAREVFSELLKRAIEEAEGKFGYQMYLPFKELEERLVARDVETVPDVLEDRKHARAYYGIFRLVLGEDHFESLEEGEHEEIVRRSLYMDEVVDNAVSAHSLDRLSMEKEIRKRLLPGLFEMVGLEAAKQIIERIIHVTRVNRAKGAF